MAHGKKDTTKKILIFLCVAAVLCIAYFAVPKAIAIFLPFILAYVLSLAISPLVNLLNKKLKIPKRLAAGISTLAVVFTIVFLIYYVSFRLVLYVQQAADNWDAIRAYWTDVGNRIYESINSMYSKATPDFQVYIDRAYAAMLDEIQKLVAPVANALISFATGFAMRLPSALIFTIVMFLATYFMAAESDLISNIAKKFFGSSAIDKAHKIYKDMIRALGGYVKAQLLIMSIVCVPLMIGMYLAGVSHFILVAVFIAVFDALPVFGSGAVLFPWACYGLITGEYHVSVIMMVLYFVIVITRQILEPKIVGKHIGVPPIFTLMSMYCGLKLFGIIGMILGPVCILIIKNLYTAGVFDKIKFSGGNLPSDKEALKKGDNNGQ